MKVHIRRRADGKWVTRCGRQAKGYSGTDLNHAKHIAETVKANIHVTGLCQRCEKLS